MQLTQCLIYTSRDEIVSTLEIISAMMAIILLSLVWKEVFGQLHAVELRTG